MEIVWDEPKRLRNLERHHLDFVYVRDRFAFSEAVIMPTHPGKDGRRRLKAIGPLDMRLIAVVFSPLGIEGISLISARRASSGERRLYDQS